MCERLNWTISKWHWFEHSVKLERFAYKASISNDLDDDEIWNCNRIATLGPPLKW